MSEVDQAELMLPVLADICWQQGNHAEAEGLALRRIALLETKFGPDFPGLARSLFILGMIAKSKGNLREGEALLARSWNLQRQALAAEHPDRAECRREYAALLRDLGRSAEAAEVDADPDALTHRAVDERTMSASNQPQR